MTAFTLTIPDELIEEAKKIGITDEKTMLAILKDFIQAHANAPKKRQLGGAEGLVIYMPDDFNAPMVDFEDYQ